MCTKLKQTGQCNCGKVTFAVDGPVVFNELCHCRACSRTLGMSPVHLIGVGGDLHYTQGQEYIKVVNGHGKMIHAFCTECGTAIYQKPDGTSFCAVYPVSFRLETPSKTNDEVPSCLLPPDLLPKYHANYENRLMNHYDSLPKYKTFPGGLTMTNEGKVLKTTREEGK